jgi:hypothetical protein
MTKLEDFERWAEVARDEPVPPVDVAARVLRDLRRANGRASFERAMAVWAGLSVAAASIVFVLALDAWASITDPMSGLFDSLTMVMR